jgi:hypothetical protein
VSERIEAISFRLLGLLIAGLSGALVGGLIGFMLGWALR